jgi:hypothetical protein
MPLLPMTGAAHLGKRHRSGTSPGRQPPDFPVIVIRLESDRGE